MKQIKSITLQTQSDTEEMTHTFTIEESVWQTDEERDASILKYIENWLKE